MTGPGRQDMLREVAGLLKGARRDLEISALFWFAVTAALAVYTTVANDGWAWRLLLITMMLGSLAVYTALWVLRRYE